LVPSQIFSPRVFFCQANFFSPQGFFQKFTWEAKSIEEKSGKTKVWGTKENSWLEIFFKLSSYSYKSV
jgi:hypothetical protein